MKQIFELDDDSKTTAPKLPLPKTKEDLRNVLKAYLPSLEITDYLNKFLDKYED